MADEYPVTNWRPIQQQLADLGFYSGRVDGGRGPLTNGAIIAFKRSIGFSARALYGPLTHAALMRPSPVLSPMPWLVEAERVMGLHEQRDTAHLRNWFDGAVAWIDPREVPWCGAFIATCLRKWRADIALPVNPLGARQWGAWGDRCQPQRGAVMTFWRGSKSGWQGHVAFYAAEDREAYHVIGGNQSNAVTTTRIAKTRLLEARWPAGEIQPHHIRRVDARGNLSTNEA